MGKTAFQKIIDRHLVKTLPDGRMVLSLDRVWCHEITTPNAILDARARDCDVVFNPDCVKVMIDHINPAKDTPSALQGQIVREWASEHNLQFFDVGHNGVCHALIPEQGLVLPGQIGIMGDSHTCTHGAFCAFAVGVGTTDLENGIITGLWVCPPQKVISVNFTGRLPANVFAKDLILALIKKIGVNGATNSILEFGGPVIDAMSMEARMTITNMAVEAGATSGMMMVDECTLKYLAAVIEGVRTVNPFVADPELASKVNSDPDAEYDDVIEICVSDMVPVITDNYSPGDVVTVESLLGIAVNQVYIGSCTNGRIEDLRIVASIIQQLGGKISSQLRCIVVPATQRVFEMAVVEGLIEIFLQAGCFVNGPTCGACLGMSCGVIAPGEVCVSTTNRNFPGRMGKGGMVHLTSPATAAFTAVRGIISEPTVRICVSAIAKAHNKPDAVAIFSGLYDFPFDAPDYVALRAKVSGGQSYDFSGKVSYLPLKNIDTDQIIPAKYLTETEKSSFGEHCLEDASITPEERNIILNSQILVAGDNFGCGSSREHAPWALEAVGIKCVIASSFARIFEGNMFANGLLCLTLDSETVDILFQDKPKEISIDWKEGILGWGNGKFVRFQLSDFQKELITQGGSIGVMINMAAELQEAESEQ